MHDTGDPSAWQPKSDPGRAALAPQIGQVPPGLTVDFLQTSEQGEQDFFQKLDLEGQGQQVQVIGVETHQQAVGIGHHVGRPSASHQAEFAERISSVER